MIRIAAALAALLAAPAAPAQTGAPVEQGPRNAPHLEPAFPGQTRAPRADSGVAFAVEEIAGGLEHPWGVAVLPDGALLVTERAGRMRVVSPSGEVSEPIRGIPEVLAQRQGGLLDVALHPDFETNRLVYWTWAKPLGDGMSATAAGRGRLSEDRGEIADAQEIFVQTPPSPTPMHYGSRILFDAAGEHVFVTTGEHSSRAERGYAQDLDKTYGKIIRLTPEGEAPPDNPFAGRKDAVASIWSLGHRNIQGAAIRPSTGRLWAVEHGPRGGDELNRIEPGANYGWPVVSYGINYGGSDVGEGIASAAGMTEPLYFWDPVIAPGGMLFYQGGMFADWQGDVLIASLSPGGVVRLELDGDTVTGEERLLTDRGRIRDVEIAPDGALLALTDSPDGAILRLTPRP